MQQDQENRILESVCIQHEIDHLNGVTIFDRIVNNTVTREIKYGRNEKVTIQKGSESKVLKYKKAQFLLNEGWEIING